MRPSTVSKLSQTGRRRVELAGAEALLEKAVASFDEVWGLPELERACLIDRAFVKDNAAKLLEQFAHRSCGSWRGRDYFVDGREPLSINVNTMAWKCGDATGRGLVAALAHFTGKSRSEICNTIFDRIGRGVLYNLWELRSLKSTRR